MADLKQVWEERSSQKVYQERDVVYKLHQSYFDSRSEGRDGQPVLTYRPYLIDDVSVGDSDEHKTTVNQVRLVANHFAAMFAHPPELTAVPFDGSGDSVSLAEKMSGVLGAIAYRSKVGLLQPRQAHWLALRGDACWQADWEDREGREMEHGVYWRGWDPAWCYPSLSEADLGGVEDMLITYQVHPRWARQHLGAEVPENGGMVRIFLYWDSEFMTMQVEDQPLGHMTRHHELGFVPFRWCYGSPAGVMGQSDVREIPKLQDLFNESLLLAMDAIRKAVDPAFYGKGLKKDVTPEPGTAVAIPVDAEIGEFPTGGDPQMILGVMQALDSFMTSMAGISPISATGQAQGSIVTGTAVRHQVEAAEQRAETRKAAIEETYAQLGGLTLRLIERKFSDQTVVLRAKQNALSSVDGKEVQGWYQCEAAYGGFMGLPLTDRVRVSLEGLGRLWDQHYAIKVAGLPGVTAADMSRRLDAYQINQALVAAKAQAAAQQAGGGQGGPPGGAPQRPQRPPQPRPDQLAPALAKAAHAGRNGR